MPVQAGDIPHASQDISGGLRLPGDVPQIEYAPSGTVHDLGEVGVEAEAQVYPVSVGEIAPMDAFAKHAAQAEAAKPPSEKF